MGERRYCSVAGCVRSVRDDETDDRCARCRREDRQIALDVAGVDVDHQAQELRYRASLEKWRQHRQRERSQ